MTMKRMRSVIDKIWCFSWLSERSQKVSSISVIWSTMSTGVVILLTQLRLLSQRYSLGEGDRLYVYRFDPSAPLWHRCWEAEGLTAWFWCLW